MDSLGCLHSKSRFIAKSNMKIPFLVLTVLASSAFGDTNFKDCDPSSTSQYVKNFSIIIEPNPVKVDRNEKVNLHISTDLIKEIPQGAKVKVKLLVKGGFIDVLIPCTDIRYINNLMSQI